MAESLPVVTVPGDDDEGLGSPHDIVLLHEVVVEELSLVEGLEGIDTTPFTITEPSESSEPSAEDVIVIGSSGEEEEETGEQVRGRGGSVVEEKEAVEGVSFGSSRGGMAGIHPVTVPSEMPIDDVPPDETMTALPVDDVETANPKAGVGDEEIRVSETANTEIRVSTEEKVTVVEEVVTSVVEEVEVAAEEVVVKVNEVLSVKETVEVEAEGEKGEKKRVRDDDEEEEDAAKKLKSEEEVKVVEPKKLGPKVFTTAENMFSYFYNLLHDWNLDQNVNKYEFMVLSELVSQGNPQKVGGGIAAFQVRTHPSWQSRCYYLIREDGSEDDFSYRKCCDALMPLPPSLYRKNGELNLEKLFPGQKGRHHRGDQQNGGGRGGGRGDHRGGRGGGGGRFGGRGGGRGGGGRRGGRGRW